MIQLPLFKPDNLKRRVKDGQYFIVERGLANGYVVCFPYVPNVLEKDGQVWYYIKVDELEDI